MFNLMFLFTVSLVTITKLGHYTEKGEAVLTLFTIKNYSFTILINTKVTGNKATRFQLFTIIKEGLPTTFVAFTGA